MKKSAKSKQSRGPKVDPYFEGVVAKLVDRLIVLERKIDTVIAQTAGKASHGGGDQQKPAQNQQPKQPPRKERTMYEAICADCHKVCEVPFRPLEDRPVYCKECYAKRKAGNSGKAFPVLTPVALAPKPASKPLVMPQSAPAQGVPKKAKKSKPERKTKKKKK